jgi:transcriptional regulator with XRE-family HTH domain
MLMSIATPNGKADSIPEMSTLAERIRTAMDESGVTQAELARACGVKPPSVHGWLSGKSKYLRGENLLQAAQVLGVNEDWLANGRGEMKRGARNQGVPTSNWSKMLTPVAETAQEQRLLVAYRLSDTDGKAALDAMVERLMQRTNVDRATGN